MAYDASVIAANLRSFRARENLTQKQVADAVELNPNTIVNYESGEGGYTVKNIYRLAEFYGTSLDELCGYFDERKAVK